MRKKFLRVAVLLPVLLFLVMCGYAQQRASERVQQAHQQGQSFAPVTPVSSRFVPMDLAQTLRQQVTSYSLFEWTAADADALARNGSAAIELTLPQPGGEPVTLELVEVNNFTNDFSAVTGTGEKIAQGNAHYYQGIVKGQPTTLAAISVFDNEVAGFFSTTAGNYVVGRVKNTDSKNGYNMVYKESSLTRKPTFECSTGAATIPTAVNAGATNLTSRCVRMMFETEYDYFVAFGYNSSAVNNYVTNMFNQVKTLYNNDGVSVALSQVIIWTTNDPYTGGDTYSTLSQFQSVRTSYVGDVGQLLTTRGTGGGLAAVINGLCGPVYNTLCVSGNLATSFPNVPTYSWEVYVVTHEFGHLLGSRHTHACVWNGNNTAIDGCSGFTEEGCAVPGIPSGGGTIMSYCHWQGVGINFNLGFGPQPAAKIVATVEAATCLSSCGAPCDAPTSLSASSITTTSATVSWAGASGAVSYTVEYKTSASGTWIGAGTTGSTSLSLTGLSPSTVYDWRVRTNCSSNSSGYAQSQFTTQGTVSGCSAPTGLSAYGDCGYAEMYWSAVSGASTYTVEYKRTTSSTWLTAESATPNTWTSINGIGGAYNWRVRANCSDGSITAWTNGPNFNILNFNSPICSGCFKIQSSVKITPQPASNGRATLTIEMPKAAPKMALTIYNQFGTPLYNQVVNLKEGFNSIQLNVSSLKKGSYSIQMRPPDCPRMAVKFIVGE